MYDNIVYVQGFISLLAWGHTVDYSQIKLTSKISYVNALTQLWNLAF